MRWVCVWLCVCLACGDDSSPPSEDAGVDAFDTGAVDVGVDTFVAPDTHDAFVEPPLCDDPAEFQTGTGDQYGDIAGDFTVETLDGTWSFRDNFTGCESYIFINYAAGRGDAVWNSPPVRLLESSPPNVQYFFTSYEDNARARVEQLNTAFEETFEFYTEEEIAAWRERLHFVVTPLLEIEGSAGDRARAQPGIADAFGIDRDQRFDPVGSLAQITGGAFMGRLQMAAFAADYYNYEHDLQVRLDAEDATVVPFVDGETLTERVFIRDIELPDAETMAGFDHLDIDVEVFCRGRASECSEWDRIALIEVCLDETCDTRHEIVRWITPYSRPGQRRWIIDASPFLGHLRAGGTQQLRFTMGPEWERATPRDVWMRARLSTRGEPSSLDVQRAYTGGNFDANYADAHPPFTFSVPDEATRVELVVIVSGHGQTEGDNCAEWCEHEHRFTVNGGGTSLIAFPDEVGRSLGCADLASEGVVPGQYGNWAPRRAGWCPGWPVDARRFDITDDVVSGDNELVYDASFAGGDPRGGNIALSTYVVSYTD